MAQNALEPHAAKYPEFCTLLWALNGSMHVLYNANWFLTDTDGFKWRLWAVYSSGCFCSWLHKQLIHSASYLRSDRSFTWCSTYCPVGGKSIVRNTVHGWMKIIFARFLARGNSPLVWRRKKGHSSVGWWPSPKVYAKAWRTKPATSAIRRKKAMGNCDRFPQTKTFLFGRMKGTTKRTVWVEKNQAAVLFHIGTYTILYYTILYYTILYYTLLYYTILYHTDYILYNTWIDSACLKILHTELYTWIPK